MQLPMSYVELKKNKSEFARASSPAKKIKSTGTANFNAQSSTLATSTLQQHNVNLVIMRNQTLSNNNSFYCLIGVERVTHVRVMIICYYRFFFIVLKKTKSRTRFRSNSGQHFVFGCGKLQVFVFFGHSKTNL